MLLLNCHQRTHISACCYWTDTRVHTFQRVVIELTPEYSPFNVLLWLSGLDQSQKQDAQGPITTWVWPQGPNYYISMTAMSQSLYKYDLQVPVRSTEVWPCGPNELQRYDLVGPISYRAKPATELWPRPSQLQKYDLVGPTSYRIMTWAQPVTEVWLSEPNLLQKYGSHSLHYVGDSFHLIESPSCT